MVKHFNEKLIFVIAVILLSVVLFRTEEKLNKNYVIEDAYYSLTVAKNIAQGKGIVITDNKLTNGFQPLFTFYCSLLYYISPNQATAIRLVQVSEYLLLIITSLIAGLIFNLLFKKVHNIAYWVSTAYLSSFLLYLNYMNGLETALAGTLFILVVYLYLSNRSYFLIALTLGFAGFTRIDLNILSFIYLLSLAFSKKWKEFAISASIIFIISAPWLIYNYLIFGSAMPSSGQSLTDFSITYHKVIYFAASIGYSTFPFLYFTSRFENDYLSIFLLICSILLFFKLFVKYKDNIKSKSFFFFFILSIIVYYFTFSGAYYFYQRYFVYLNLLLFTYVLGYIHSLIGEKIKSFIYIYLIAIASLHFVNTFTNFSQGSIYHNHQLNLANKYIGSDSKIAAYQTGTLGYFRDNVTNLDGKVNSEALKYKNNMAYYLDSLNIDYFVDWDEFVIKANLSEQKWKLIDSSGMFYLYRRNDILGK